MCGLIYGLNRCRPRIPHNTVAYLWHSEVDPECNKAICWCLLCHQIEGPGLGNSVGPGCNHWLHYSSYHIHIHVALKVEFKDMSFMDIIFWWTPYYQMITYVYRDKNTLFYYNIDHKTKHILAKNKSILMDRIAATRAGLQTYDIQQ